MPKTWFRKTPENFKAQYNIDVRVNSEVVAIDRKENEVTVRDLETGTEYAESYDKLILSPGGEPIIPQIPGIEKVKSYSIRNVVDINKIAKAVKGQDVKNISVIGGGFIGIETVENLKVAGYEVTLIEAMSQILRIFDYDMVQTLHKELSDHGVNLILKDKVISFDTDMIILESGEKIASDLVIMAIGVCPETNLAKEAGLRIGKNRCHES